MWLFAKNILFTLVVPGTVGVYVPLWIARGDDAPATVGWSAWHFAALVPLTAGAAIYLWCLYDFATAGRGTPAPIDPPQRLVIRGLYRYVRNPMYLGVLLVIASWAVWFASWPIAAYALGIAVMFNVFVFFIEEPMLRRQFGTDYENYRRTVGRWLPRAPQTRRN